MRSVLTCKTFSKPVPMKFDPSGVPQRLGLINGVRGDHRTVNSLWQRISPKRTSGPKPISGLLGIQFSMSVTACYGQLFCYYLDDVEHKSDSQCPSPLLD